MKTKYCKKIKGKKTCTVNAEEEAGEVGKQISSGLKYI